MSAHSHRKYVEGCFRCDLSRDEVGTERPPDGSGGRGPLDGKTQDTHTAHEPSERES